MSPPFGLHLRVTVGPEEKARYRPRLSVSSVEPVDNVADSLLNMHTKRTRRVGGVLFLIEPEDQQMQS